MAIDGKTESSQGSISDIIVHPRLAEQFGYEIRIVNNGGISQLNNANRAFLNIKEDGNTLEFKEKRNFNSSLFVIPLKKIETTTTITSQTKQIVIKRNNVFLEITFTDEQGSKKSIRIDLDERYIQTIQKQINQFRDERINSSITRAIAVARNPKLCIQCAKNKYALEYRLDYNLCLECFTRRYGKALLEATKAEYHGGHKAYLGGGAFSKFENGRLILSEHYLIFTKENEDPAKRWEIIIPLKSIIARTWGIQEQGRRQQILGGGTSLDELGFGIGSGVIHNTGKAHQIVVPYIDENGIPQEPRFGVSSFRGNAIKEWATKLYEQVVKENTNHTASPKTVEDNNVAQLNGSQQPAVQSLDDPIKVLKLRFAKGEITKVEYDEMKKTLES